MRDLLVLGRTESVTNVRQKNRRIALLAVLLLTLTGALIVLSQMRPLTIDVSSEGELSQVAMLQRLCVELERHPLARKIKVKSSTADLLKLDAGKREWQHIQEIAYSRRDHTFYQSVFTDAWDKSLNYDFASENALRVASNAHVADKYSLEPLTSILDKLGCRRSKLRHV